MEKNQEKENKRFKKTIVISVLSFIFIFIFLLLMEYVVTPLGGKGIILTVIIITIVLVLMAKANEYLSTRMEEETKS